MRAAFSILRLTAFFIVVCAARAAAQTAPPSPAPAASPACAAPASQIALDTSTICVNVTGSGGAVTAVGPFVDLHGVTAPTVAITAWDASGATLPVSITCGNVTQTSSCAWPQVNGSYQPLTFTAGGYTLGLVALQSSFALDTGNAGALRVHCEAHCASGNFSLDGAIRSRINGVPLTLQSPKVAFTAQNVTVGPTAFTIGGPSSGTAAPALQGAVQATLPRTANGSTGVQASVQFGGFSLTGVQFHGESQSWYALGNLAVDSPAWSIKAPAMFLSVTPSGFALKPQIASQPPSLHMNGTGISLDATLSDLRYEKAGDAAVSASVAYTIGGTVAKFDVTGDSAPGRLHLEGNADAQTPNSAIHAQSLTVDDSSGALSVAADKLSVDLGSTGQMSADALTYTAGAFGATNLHLIPGAGVSSIVQALTLQDVHGAACSGTSGAQGRDLCLTFVPTLDLGLPDVLAPGSGQIAFSNSSLTLGAAPHLHMGRLTRTHVTFEDGLALNLKSCDDSSGETAARVKEEADLIKPSTPDAAMQNICLDGSVTLPDSFASIVPQRVINIEKFAYGADGKIRICLVACLAEGEVRRTQEVFDAGELSAGNASDPPVTLPLTFAPGYALNVASFDLEIKRKTAADPSEAITGASELQLLHKEAGANDRIAYLDLDYQQGVQYPSGSQTGKPFYAMQISGSSMVPLRLSDMTLLLTQVNGSFDRDHYSLHAKGVASLVNEPVTVVFNDLGIDATRSTPAAPVTGQRQHDWNVTFTHSINKNESLAVSGARAVPRVFQFLENAATLLVGKWLFAK